MIKNQNKIHLQMENEIHPHTTAAITEQETIKKESKINIPDEQCIMSAKDWLDNGSKR